MAPLAGPLSVESLCARQAGHRGEGRGRRETKREEKEEKASSRSIAKHRAELVYRRIEGERRIGEGVEGKGKGNARGDVALS